MQHSYNGHRCNVIVDNLLLDKSSTMLLIFAFHHTQGIASCQHNLQHESLNTKIINISTMVAKHYLVVKKKDSFLAIIGVLNGDDPLDLA
jgi:hypothetical protein